MTTFGSRLALDCAVTGADVVAGGSACRVLLAVMDGHIVISDIAVATGLTRSVVHHRLRELRDLGLVDWVEHKQATIHPVSQLVAAVCV